MKEHVHLIGIGGTGMTALAGLLAASGCRVTGSDRELYPPTSTILAGLSVEVFVGYRAANLHPAPDLVVVGNAISRGNEELEELLDSGLPYTSMPRLIAERFLRGRHSIVVAGTHGKTTTTSMLACVLDHAGANPGFLIGGSPMNFDLPFRVGTGAAFVIEGDEYDTAFFDKGPKFMHYRPNTALLGTVEFDHADIYRDLDAVKTAFRRLIRLVPRGGLVVRHEESPIGVEISTPSFSRVEGYGIREGDWTVVDLEHGRDETRFRVLKQGSEFAAVRLGVTGDHNVCNALAALVAANEQGIPAARIAEGLSRFRGVRRRLELRGESAGVQVLDDFAHHPTAIEGTLRAVRARTTEGRVWAVLEPRSWSLRRSVFQDRLPGSLAAADRVVIAAVHAPEAIPDGERLDPQRVVDDLTRTGHAAAYIPDVPNIVRHIAAGAEPGDTIVVMSNGAFGDIHGLLLEALRESREPAGPRA